MLWGILILALLQDPSELIDQLGHDDALVREAAEKKLVEIGSPALEKLRAVVESSDPEVRERVQRIIQAIELNAKFDKAYTPPVPINAAGTKTVQEALALIGCQTAPRDVLDRPVTLDLKNATPFDLLDTVCRQVESLNYVIEGEQIRFTREPFIDAPSYSFEAFRVRLTRIESFARSDFQKKRYVWSFALQAEAFPSAKTFAIPLLTVYHVKDDQDKRATRTEDVFIVGAPDSSPQLRGWMESMKHQAAMARVNRVFNFASERPTERLSSVKGTASFFFRIDPQDLRLEPGKAAHLTELTITATTSAVGVRGDTVQLSVIAKRDSQWLNAVITDLVDKTSIVAVDAQGNESKLEPIVQPGQPEWMHATSAGGKIGVTGYLSLGKIKGPQVREIRLKVSGVFRKDVPFEIKNIDLP